MADPIRLVPSTHVEYDRLPIEGGDPFRSSHSPSPVPGRTSAALSQDDFPGGAAGRPRFMGPGAPGDGLRPRDSLVSNSTQDQYAPPSEYSGSLYALNTGVPDTAPLGPAGAPPVHYSSYRDDPHDLYADAPSRDAGFDTSMASEYLEKKRDAYRPPRDRSRKRMLIGAGLGILALVVIGVVLAVYFTVIKPHSNKSSSGVANSSSGSDGGGSSNPSPSSPSNTVNAVVTGGDGSTITADDGSTFTYKNSFGGQWYWDPNDPFNNGARAQSWSPAMNETFQYGVDPIRGVNLGGWLVTEPFIVPALYEKYVNSTTPAVDEWTLSEAMRADTASGGISQLENHYKTFITEQDFAQIAGAGLNWVRIPFPYWAVSTWPGEPFLEGTAWTYFLKAVQWARKYGIRINLDLHTLPGSQNGWNHSGRLGSINVLNGPMGIANAQRSLDYIRVIAEFISQPEYSNVVAIFGITNEPQASIVGQDVLESYYVEAYNVVRKASGTGQGNGPFISYHDGFIGQSNWAGFMTGADRIQLDTHPYLCFSTQSSAPLSSFVQTPCQAWGGNMNASMSAFGMSHAGEWSNAVNDCGLWVNGVNLGARYDGTFTGSWPVIGSCDPWVDWQSWTSDQKQDYKQLAMSSMDALQNWFFWTWKIGNSSVTGTVMAPHWSYSLGLEQGWMPTDPRTAVGTCGNTDPFAGPLQPWQTGGAGAGQIPSSATANIEWPPATISGGGAVASLPTYTPTGTITTLPPPTFTASSGKSTISAGNGWENSADNQGAFTTAVGCSYLDPWVGSAAPPSPLCPGVAKRTAVPEPQLTGFPMARS